MASLNSLGNGLDGLIDSYLEARSLEDAAALIRAHPELLTPAAARAVIALTEPTDQFMDRAHLLYRAELRGLARALRDRENPLSRDPLPVDPAVKAAGEAFKGSRSLDEQIKRLAHMRALPGFSDLDRARRREVDFRLAKLLLQRYPMTRQRRDLREAVVLLRRAFSAEPQIDTALLLGEAELTTFTLSGRRGHLKRAEELIEGLVEQLDPADERRPKVLLTHASLQLVWYSEEPDRDRLIGAFSSLESAADRADPRSVAELARMVLEDAEAGGHRRIAKAARRLLSELGR